MGRDTYCAKIVTGSSGRKLGGRRTERGTWGDVTLVTGRSLGDQVCWRESWGYWILPSSNWYINKKKRSFGPVLQKTRIS